MPLLLVDHLPFPSPWLSLRFWRVFPLCGALSVLGGPGLFFRRFPSLLFVCSLPPFLLFSSSFSCLSCLSCLLSVLLVVCAVLALLFAVPFWSLLFFPGCDPVIVAFLSDGFMYDARTMSYFVSGCAPGGCETDSVFFAGGPRLPDLKDFVLEAGSIVLSFVTVASPSVTFLLREFSFWSVVLLVLRTVCTTATLSSFVHVVRDVPICTQSQLLLTQSMGDPCASPDSRSTPEPALLPAEFCFEHVA